MNKPDDIRAFLRDNVLLMDGAMGTYYAKKTRDYDAACETANITAASAVREIHDEYLLAGCNAIKTNTFMANERSLDCDSAHAARIIEAGWKIASDAAGRFGAFVFADIGPISAGGDTLAHYKRIVDVFAAQGASCFLLETFAAPDCLEKLCGYIKQRCPHAFALVSFAVLPEGYTREGYFGNSLYSYFDALDCVDAVGFNCVCGPHHMLKLLRQLPAGRKPLAAMPNSGYPTVINHRTYFNTDDAGYFSNVLVDIARERARIIGGCCGTTPELLAGVRRRLDSEPTGTKAALDKTPDATAHNAQSAAPDTVAGRAQRAQPHDKQPSAPTASSGGQRISELLESGKRVIAVELDPPTDGDGAFFMQASKRLRDAGADAVTIADCPVSRARADSSILACKIHRELGIDAIPHMTCRDRNINATKALLLGLHMEGVRNILAVTGDPVPAVDRSEVKSVYNFNSPRLVRFIRELGRQLGDPFFICGALNVNALNFDAQLAHAQRKIENGVQAFLTQPVFCGQAIENLRQARSQLPAKILGGILPIVSHRNACYMDSEIAGITVGREIVCMYEGLDKQQSARLAVELALDIAKKIAPYIDGYYLITPFKRVELIEQIISELS